MLNHNILIQSAKSRLWADMEKTLQFLRQIGCDSKKIEKSEGGTHALKKKKEREKEVKLTIE